MNIDPRQEWATPKDFFHVVNHEFDFDLDAAAKVENAKCQAFISPEMDGLRAPWIGKRITVCEQMNNEVDITSASSNGEIRRVWVNPGFANLGPWMKKAYEEAQNHPLGLVVVMSLISCSTDWWKKYVDGKATFIRLIGGKRVQFEPAPGVEESSNSRENCLVVFQNEDLRRFNGTFMHTWYWTDTDAYVSYTNAGRSAAHMAEESEA